MGRAGGTGFHERCTHTVYSFLLEGSLFTRVHREAYRDVYCRVVYNREIESALNVGPLRKIKRSTFKLQNKQQHLKG